MADEAPPGDPKRWHTREDSGLRLDRHVRWWHDGEPVEHPKIAALFDEGLSPTDDGRYLLRVGADWCYVQVDDAAYRVTGIDPFDDRIYLRLSDRTAELLQPASLVHDSDGVLMAKVKEGRALARFTRDAQFALGELLHDEGGVPVLHLGGQRFAVLPRSAAPKDPSSS